MILVFCKMTLLVTIVTNGLSGILLRPSTFISTSSGVTAWSVSCINPGGWGGILRPFFSVLSLPFLLFLLFFPSLVRGLSTIEVLSRWGFLFLGPGLRFFNPCVLYWLDLDTGFGCWRPTTLKVRLIGVAGIRIRPESGLSFGVDGFFDYFFKSIELLAALLYFNLHWRPEILLKGLNHCIFL